MDETIWLYIGIVAALIGVASVVMIFNNHSQQEKGQLLSTSVQSYKELCIQVCDLPVDTKLSVKSALPAGALLSTTDDAVCGRLESKLFCGRCPCAVEPNATILDLQGNGTSEYFRQHEYRCSMTKTNTTVVMACSG